MPSKDELLLKRAFNCLRDNQENPKDFYKIEQQKIDFINRWKTLKRENMRLLKKCEEVNKQEDKQ